MKQSEEYRELQRQLNYKRWDRPGEREKLARRNREMWADPASRIAQSVAIANAQKKDADKIGARMRARWQCPEARKKLMNACKERWQHPEAHEHMSAAMRARWADPNMRRKFIDALYERWRDPIIRQKMIAGRAKARKDKQ